MKLSTNIKIDEALQKAIAPFDYTPSNPLITEIPDFEPPSDAWSIGVIVGPSGSGKSTILKKYFRKPVSPTWSKNLAIASQVSADRLMSVGLNSIPSWCRPYHTLSTGEAFRADLASTLASNSTHDEFTSTVDRTVAKSVSRAISRQIRKEELHGVVFASCHYDILDWLEPDWVFDTLTGSLRRGRCLWRRPTLNIKVCDSSSNLWHIFGKHHYLNTTINKSAKCFMAYWDDVLVGFSSCLAFPNGNFNNGYREHRTVILPDYQGMGIGVRLSDFVANHMCLQGKRYFSKTAHPRMGMYREHSPLWKPTSKNKKARADYDGASVTKEAAYRHLHKNRVCYSHEFVLSK